MIEGTLFICNSSDEFIVVHTHIDPGYEPIIGRFDKGVLNFRIFQERGYFISILVKLDQRRFDLHKKNVERFLKKYEKGAREWAEKVFGQMKEINHK